MCLGIPGEIVSLDPDGDIAMVDVSGSPRPINLGMLDGQPLARGDWVLIHMGFAMEKIDAAQAQDAERGLRLIAGDAELP